MKKKRQFRRALAFNLFSEETTDLGAEVLSNAFMNSEVY